jgi:hypothetical protein
MNNTKCRVSVLFFINQDAHGAPVEYLVKSEPLAIDHPVDALDMFWLVRDLGLDDLFSLRAI